MVLGLHLICSNYSFPHFPKMLPIILFHSYINTNYSRIIPTLFLILKSCSFQTLPPSDHGWIHLRLPSEFKVKSSSEYKLSLLSSSSSSSAIFEANESPSSSPSLISHHSPFQLFLYHARECPIIIILCLWASYYSRIMLAKIVDL